MSEFTYPTEKPIIRCLTVDGCDRTIVGGHVTPGFRETCQRDVTVLVITVRNHVRYSGRHVLDIGKESVSSVTVVRVKIVSKISDVQDHIRTLDFTDDSRTGILTHARLLVGTILT